MPSEFSRGSRIQCSQALLCLHWKSGYSPEIWATTDSKATFDHMFYMRYKNLLKNKAQHNKHYIHLDDKSTK